MGVLIADSGSTKTDWLYVGNEGKRMFETTGINPFYHSTEHIVEVLQSQQWPSDVDTVYFYGAGVSNENNSNSIRKAFDRTIKPKELHIEHDLLGAARALCGKTPGVACILGTGSNSCAFDGKNITKNIMSLGFLLGDEGSGAHISKLLWKAYLLEELDSETAQLFATYHGKTRSSFLEEFYAHPNKNRFVASFVPFLAEHRNEKSIRIFIESSFDAFIKRYLLKYPSAKQVPIHFTGSVAFHFSDILEERLVNHGLLLGRIMQKPITALANYHLNES